jgi:hypothetical protein
MSLGGRKYTNATGFKKHIYLFPFFFASIKSELEWPSLSFFDNSVSCQQAGASPRTHIDISLSSASQPSQRPRSSSSISKRRDIFLFFKLKKPSHHEMLLDELENNIFSNEETGARTVPLGNWESPTIGRKLFFFLFLFFIFKKKGN